MWCQIFSNFKLILISTKKFVKGHKLWQQHWYWQFCSHFLLQQQQVISCGGNGKGTPGFDIGEDAPCGSTPHCNSCKGSLWQQCQWHSSLQWRQGCSLFQWWQGCSLWQQHWQRHLVTASMTLLVVMVLTELLAASIARALPMVMVSTALLWGQWGGSSCCNGGKGNPWCLLQGHYPWQ